MCCNEERVICKAKGNIFFSGAETKRIGAGGKGSGKKSIPGEELLGKEVEIIETCRTHGTGLRTESQQM